MLGVGVLNLLPHAFYELEKIEPVQHGSAIQQTVGWLMVGFLVMFFIERVFHFHHHDVPARPSRTTIVGTTMTTITRMPDMVTRAAGETKLGRGVGRAFVAQHARRASRLAPAWRPNRKPAEEPVGPAWSFFSRRISAQAFRLDDLGTLMALDGRSSTAKHLVNGLYALAIPLGAHSVSIGGDNDGRRPASVRRLRLGFCRRHFFVYLDQRSTPRIAVPLARQIQAVAALLLGLSLAYGLTVLEESGHDHGHKHDRSTEHSGHKETGHAHDHK